MKVEYEDVNGNVWRIDRSVVVKDMHAWAKKCEPSGSFGKCITTGDVLLWVNDNCTSITGWELIERLAVEPDIPVSNGCYVSKDSC